MTEKVSGAAPLTSAQRAALREVAEKATSHRWGANWVENDIWVETEWEDEIARCRTCEDAEFIAEADPSTVLSLLDENEELRKVLAGRGIGSESSVSEELRGCAELLHKDGFAEWASHLEAKATRIDAVLSEGPMQTIVHRVCECGHGENEHYGATAEEGAFCEGCVDERPKGCESECAHAEHVFCRPRRSLRGDEGDTNG